jgi:tRNA(fMet)-specific endonuclease VapC
MRYLLDTNMLSDAIRNPNGRVANRVREAGDANVCTSVVVAAELRFGAARKKSPRLTALVDEVLGEIDVLPLEAPADAAYAAVRYALETKGQPISGNDLLIAAHALALGYTLVTANMREFSRVDGLMCENWLLD